MMPHDTTSTSFIELAPNTLDDVVVLVAYKNMRGSSSYLQSMTHEVLYGGIGMQCPLLALYTNPVVDISRWEVKRTELFTLGQSLYNDVISGHLHEDGLNSKQIRNSATTHKTAHAVNMQCMVNE